MKISTLTLILNLCILFILFKISYQWGLRYWVEMENKKVKIYNSLENCFEKCSAKDCYSITDYHEEAKKALTNLGFDFNKTSNQAICYTKNTPIEFNEWAHPDSNYFKIEEAIFYTFQYEDICNSFCQPLYKSGCSLTYTGWKCYKATAPIITIPKNKTEADFKLPENFTIQTQADEGEEGDCLKFKADEQIEFTGCTNSTDFTFHAEHLDQNHFAILHDNPKGKNGTKYALTYSRNYDVLKFEELRDNYYKQAWNVDSICHGKYRFQPFNITGLCARIDFLRKCDDDKKEIGNLQIYTIAERK